MGGYFHSEGTGHGNSWDLTISKGDVSITFQHQHFQAVLPWGLRLSGYGRSRVSLYKAELGAFWNFWYFPSFLWVTISKFTWAFPVTLCLHSVPCACPGQSVPVSSLPLWELHQLYSDMRLASASGIDVGSIFCLSKKGKYKHSLVFLCLTDQQTQTHLEESAMNYVWKIMTIPKDLLEGNRFLAGAKPWGHPMCLNMDFPISELIEICKHIEMVTVLRSQWITFMIR